MMYFILGIALLAFFMMLVRWFPTASARDVKRLLVLLSLIIGLAIMAVFILSGRFVLSLAAIPLILPWVRRALIAKRMYDFFRPGRGRFSGNQNSGSQQSAGDNMTRAEALQVLDLKEGASDAEIKKAHHRLINKIHPDHDGSTYLASQINRAKEVLLG